MNVRCKPASAPNASCDQARSRRKRMMFSASVSRAVSGGERLAVLATLCTVAQLRGTPPLSQPFLSHNQQSGTKVHSPLMRPVPRSEQAFS
jgi:hypothetical protein